MRLTNQQIKIIHTLLPDIYKKDKEQKKGLIYQFTGSYNKTSTRDLTFVQANELIKRLGGKPVGYEHWGLFDATVPAHLKVLSLLQEIGWVVWSEDKSRNIADIHRLSEFLKSKKSPVNMPLKKMTPLQISKKLIPALEGISKSMY